MSSYKKPLRSRIERLLRYLEMNLEMFEEFMPDYEKQTDLSYEVRITIKELREITKLLIDDN